MERTVALNGIMRNSAQHCKLGILIQIKTLSHPWEEVRQAVVSSSDALGDACATASERQGTNAVWPKNDIGVCFSEGKLWF